MLEFKKMSGRIPLLLEKRDPGAGIYDLIKYTREEGNGHVGQLKKE
jgi:hypothetical protein